jgi:NTP pyrophosphatase (non-canonical NTP hydrolase)
MQLKACEYLEPTSYVCTNGFTHNNCSSEETNAFVNDMLYMLDCPEQLESELQASWDYQTEALRTESAMRPLGPRYICEDGENRTDYNRLLHAAMGMATEAGEFLDPIKKHLFYGKPLDLVNLREEVGDLLWYIAIACDALDTTIDAEMQRNIAKLRKRYPEKFDSVQAVERDLEGERKVLEA